MSQVHPRSEGSAGLPGATCTGDDSCAADGSHGDGDSSSINNGSGVGSGGSSISRHEEDSSEEEVGSEQSQAASAGGDGDPLPPSLIVKARAWYKGLKPMWKAISGLAVLCGMVGAIVGILAAFQIVPRSYDLKKWGESCSSYDECESNLCKRLPGQGALVCTCSSSEGNFCPGELVCEGSFRCVPRPSAKPSMPPILKPSPLPTSKPTLRPNPAPLLTTPPTTTPVSPTARPSFSPSKSLAFRTIQEIRPDIIARWGSMDVSNNGRFIAFSVIGDFVPGYVEVHEITDENVTQVGQQIKEREGARTYDFGTNVVISDDGDTLLVHSRDYYIKDDSSPSGDDYVGLLQVYQLMNKEWKLSLERTGSDVSPPHPLKFSSLYAATMSNDGNHVVMGSLDNGVQMYEYGQGSPGFLVSTFQSDWLAPKEIGDGGFAGGIAVSGKGEAVVIAGTGYAYVYRAGRNAWLEGQRFDGEYLGQLQSSFYGQDVAISNDGSVIAVGDVRSFERAGSVSVFQYNRFSRKYEAHGSVLTPPANSDETWGYQMYFSQDGKLLLIIPSGSFPQQSRLFEFKSNDWEEIETIGIAGDSCSMSGNGEVIACIIDGMVTVMKWSR